MLPTLPPIEQSSLGVAMHGEEASAPSILEMTEAILLAEGAIYGRGANRKIHGEPKSCESWGGVEDTFLPVHNESGFYGSFDDYIARSFGEAV